MAKEKTQQARLGERPEEAREDAERIPTVPCKVWFGELSYCTVGEALVAAMEKERPVLVWREPANQRLPLPLNDFEGLTLPTAAGVEQKVDLVEARLFFASGMLHVLRNGRSVQWAAWQEGVGNAPLACPEWCIWEALGEWEERLCLTCRDVLLRGSDTTGLRGANLGLDRVRAVEYFRDGRLSWWRLQINGDAT